MSHANQRREKNHLLTLYRQKLQSLRYILAADSMSIFIAIFVVGSKNACILKQSAKWPFKVIQGH